MKLLTPEAYAELAEQGLSHEAIASVERGLAEDARDVEILEKRRTEQKHERMLSLEEARGARTEAEMLLAYLHKLPPVVGKPINDLEKGAGGRAQDGADILLDAIFPDQRKVTLRQNTPTKPPMRNGDRNVYIVSGEIHERQRYDVDLKAMVGTGQRYAVNHDPFAYGRDRREARREAREARKAELRAA